MSPQARLGLTEALHSTLQPSTGVEMHTFKVFMSRVGGTQYGAKANFHAFVQANDQTAAKRTAEAMHPGYKAISVAKQ